MYHGVDRYRHIVFGIRAEMEYSGGGAHETYVVQTTRQDAKNHHTTIRCTWVTVCRTLVDAYSAPLPHPSRLGNAGIDLQRVLRRSNILV